MSQSGALKAQNVSPQPIVTITGNSGAAVPPDASGNINLLGNDATGITVVGTPASNLLTIIAELATTTQRGTLATATNAQAAAQTSLINILTPSNITSMFSTNPLPATQGGTGVASPTAHTLPVAEGASNFTFLGPLTNGQLLIGSTGADPVPATLTAGSGISISNGVGSITISSSGAEFLTYTNVSTTPYVVLTTDEYLSVDTSALSITIQLPNTTSTGRVFVIKDRSGAAATRNISVTTVGGVITIDGSTTYTINTNFEAIQVIFNGTNYEVF